MPVNSTVKGNKVEITVSGRFDFNLHREFRDTYRYTDGPASEYEVNLRGVDYLDSAALGMLLLLREHGGGERARVTVCNCNPEIAKILQIANFHRLFKLV